MFIEFPLIKLPSNLTLIIIISFLHAIYTIHTMDGLNNESAKVVDLYVVLFRKASWCNDIPFIKWSTFQQKHIFLRVLVCGVWCMVRKAIKPNDGRIYHKETKGRKVWTVVNRIIAPTEQNCSLNNNLCCFVPLIFLPLLHFLLHLFILTIISVETFSLIKVFIVDCLQTLKPFVKVVSIVILAATKQEQEMKQK